MGITIGSKLGPYEIVSLIGAGGMGEVYRAHDTRLKREVAIKILSDNGFSNNEVKKRFQFEARTASSLNHPNIVAVYDVGGENEKPYIVSELVEGDNLRKLLAKGPLPIRIVLDIAVQIADGLAAAHRAGIVHRDLKPENIMITGQGHAKILDFGLAKLRMDVETEGQTQTLSRPLSEAGMRHGTVPYMSPEQASGEQLDYRSDQFSFGCILYEMATGKCAFLKESAPRTLAAILSEEPTPISELNARVPAPVRWVIDRCLSKEPKQRYDSTVDLHRELRHLRDHLSEAITTDKIFPPQPPHRSIRKWIVPTIALLFGVSLIVLLLHGKAPQLDLTSYQYTPLETGPMREVNPAWSPDGKAIAFTSRQQVFIRNLESSTAAQITHSEARCRDPFWSADGSRIYYISLYNGKPALWWIGVAGGKSDLLVENVFAATVSHKDGTLALLRPENDSFTLWLAESSGSNLRKFTPQALAKKKLFSGKIEFSPDGSKIGFLAIGATQEVEFWVISYPNGEPRRYLQNTEMSATESFRWLPSNHEIVYARKNLWIADLKKNSVRAITAARGQLDRHRYPSVSPDGKKIAFTWTQQNWDILEIPLESSSTRLHATKMYESSPMWSPHGKSYLYATDRRGTSEIWIRNQETGTQQPVVTQKDFPSESDDVILDSPAFSPDGQRVAFQRGIGRGLEQSIWFTNLAGGRPVRLTKKVDATGQDAPTWSPDGNWIAYCAQHPDYSRAALAKARAGLEQQPVIIRKGALYYRPVWSPTGEWITFKSQDGLSIVSPDGKKIELLSRKDWWAGCWSSDGTILYGIIREKNRSLLVEIALSNREEKIVADLGSFEEEPPEFWGLSLNKENQVFLTSMSTLSLDLWILEGF